MHMTFFLFTFYSALEICLCEREPNHLKNQPASGLHQRSRILGTNMTLISKILLISGSTILKAGFSVVCHVTICSKVRSQATMKVQK